ncbi:STAS domain-containing protein [Streptomyces sp. NBC_00435]|uniref:STAS domain-containing protein n=1 Tax=Streptomyces sp. NBC_00435 TaxID=2903649 RepID=UPI002E1E9655
MDHEQDPTPPVEVDKQEQQAFVHVGGEMDIDRAPLLEEALRTLITQPDCPPEVVLDLSELTFCDSSGLSAFLQGHRTAQEHGRRIVLHAPNQRFVKLLELTGARRLFPIT